MTYGQPSIESVLERFREQNVQRLLVLPLYPQYSSTTTGSIFEFITRELSQWRWMPELRFVNQYWQRESYLRAVADSIARALADARAQAPAVLVPLDPEALFHGRRSVSLLLPRHRTGRRGAAGPARGRMVGRFPVALRPRGMAQALRRRVAAGICGVGPQARHRRLPGFATDCLETLEEISMQNREMFLRHGGEAFDYVPCLNSSPAHVAVMEDVVLQHTGGWQELGDARARRVGTRRRPRPRAGPRRAALTARSTPAAHAARTLSRSQHRRGTTSRESLAFYESLGFVQATAGEAWPHAYAVVTDGRLCLGLHAQEPQAPLLTWVAPDLRARLDQFAALGIEPRMRVSTTWLHQALLRSPAGQRLRLIEARTFSPPTCTQSRDEARLFRGVRLARQWPGVCRGHFVLGAAGFRRVRTRERALRQGRGVSRDLNLALYDLDLRCARTGVRAAGMGARIAGLRDRGPSLCAAAATRTGAPLGAAMLEAPEGTRLLLLDDEPPATAGRQASAADRRNDERISSTSATWIAPPATENGVMPKSDCFSRSSPRTTRPVASRST